MGENIKKYAPDAFVIVITGGTQGIGEAVSTRVAEEGGIPVFIGRTEAHGKRLLGTLEGRGLKGHFLQADLTDPLAC